MDKEKLMDSVDKLTEGNPYIFIMDAGKTINFGIRGKGTAIINMLVNAIMNSEDFDRMIQLAMLTVIDEKAGELLVGLNDSEMMPN